MIRRIVCRECKDLGPTYSKRDRCFWSRRVVFIVCGSSVVCDECNKALLGEIGQAVTLWQGEEPPDWEDNFGEIIPNLAVKVHDSLVKNRGDQ